MILAAAFAAILQGGAGSVTLVEQELPKTLVTNRVEGVKLYFRGGSGPVGVRELGLVATGEVTSDQAAAAGFPAPTRLQRGNCPEVLNAALQKLAKQAKDMGADAVLDIHSVDNRGVASPGERPNYLCIVRARRPPPTDRSQPPWAHSVALSGTAALISQRP